MAIVLYARVSGTEQTIEHQRTQAEQAGFKLDEVISDNGVSGVSTKLAERTQGRRLFDLLRSGDTLVVRWVDRLGRNYEDICETIREFHAPGRRHSHRDQRHHVRWRDQGRHAARRS
jgi:putative DNA-invertase from lambdoid prophage Rac